MVSSMYLEKEECKVGGFEIQDEEVGVADEDVPGAKGKSKSTSQERQAAWMGTA